MITVLGRESARHSVYNTIISLLPVLFIRIDFWQGDDWCSVDEVKAFRNNLNYCMMIDTGTVDKSLMRKKK